MPRQFSKSAADPEFSAARRSRAADGKFLSTMPAVTNFETGDLPTATSVILATEPLEMTRTATPPTLSTVEVKQLFDGIRATTLVGLRDRALIALLAYTSARVEAVVAMKVRDFYVVEGQRWLRLCERGGKRTELLCHELLVLYIDEWLLHYDMKNELDAPMFPTLRRGNLKRGSCFALPAANVRVQIQHYAKAAGLSCRVGACSFRAADS